ncbi:MAG TPA: hypothetical protein VM639_12620 [Dongiaceae bacterium]|nr:hypothetical protein [Dongiaceae bacterium]
MAEDSTAEKRAPGEITSTIDLTAAEPPVAGTASLRHELMQLELACTRLKSHPALLQMLEVVRLSPGHAHILLGYAEQLTVLMRTVNSYTAQLERLAAVDVDAVAALIIAKRTATELDHAVSPVIEALRRHALALIGMEDAAPSGRLH